MEERSGSFLPELPYTCLLYTSTGLANEEVVGGKCERCGAEVTKKNLRQWMLRITKYADRLLNDLDKLDWPEKVKKMQADWIGKSYGAEVDFPVEGRDEKSTVYTTRPDTLHGATFMAVSYTHLDVYKRHTGIPHDHSKRKSDDKCIECSGHYSAHRNSKIAKYIHI